MFHAMTVDVEDWYTGIPLDRSTLGPSDRRLRGSMDTLLETLDRAGVRGTFFWLGELAEAYPDLVRRVAAAGHRIGCHGWTHEFLHRIPPDALEKQVSAARDLLEDLSGAPVLSFRAPFFSITRETIRTLDMLARLGFSIDSSIFPAWNWRYGIPGFPAGIRRVRRKGGSLWLAPITTRRFPGLSIPVSGGAYLRLYPYALTRSNFLWAQRKNRPAVFYLHPWELDPSHPRRSFDLRARLTHYTGLSTCREKLDRLLAEFRFEPLEDVVERLRATPLSPGTGRPRGALRRGVESLLWDRGVARRTAVHGRWLEGRSAARGVLLDIGSRDGRVLTRVSRASRASLAIGMDLERTAFPSLEEEGPRWVQGDGEVLPLRDGSVDAILCTSTFKHVWDADAFLGECLRVLTPGGHLFLADLTPSGIRLALAARRFPEGAVQRTLDLDALCALLVDHGFSVEHRERFMAVPLSFPGTEALEGFLRRNGLDGRMFYQMVVAGKPSLDRRRNRRQQLDGLSSDPGTHLAGHHG